MGFRVFLVNIRAGMLQGDVKIIYALTAAEAGRFLQALVKLNL